MNRPTAGAVAIPVMTQTILSPRRARTEFEQQTGAAVPFLVDRAETARTVATPTLIEHSERGVRLVLRGFARRPVLTAAVAAMVGMAVIGLFLGLMLGDLAAG